jgi:hypothetical protein
MQTVVRVTKREAYNTYDDRSELLEPIFNFFPTEPD